MRLRHLALALIPVALFAIPRSARTKSPEVFPLSKVKPGMKGYGVTVFAGSKLERFDFEVIGIAKNFLPKQDIILFKSDDPKMTDVGITRGMSGSPMYLDGKVACALAYGWGWNKKAIGGCTPIQYMIDDAKIPLRGLEQTSIASVEEWDDLRPVDRFAEAREAMGPGAPRDAWLTRGALPTIPAAPAPDEDGTGLVRAGVPLGISGMTPTAFDAAKTLFAPYGVEPVQSGGGAGQGDGPAKFEMGGAIGVTLVDGDTSAAATGTVSYVDGNTVIGFGHPMFSMGEAYLPITTAEIHTIIPSLNSSFKLSSPGRTLGTLTSDRQSSIAGDTSKKATTIPVEIRMKVPSGKTETFSSTVIRHRFLTPQLVMLVVASATGLYYPDISDAVVTMKSSIKLKGYDPLVFTDYVYSAEGASPNAVASARALRALVPLLFNPYEAVKLDRIEIDLDVSYKADFTELVGIRVPGLELPYGEKTYVELTLRPYAGKEYVEKVPLTIPERLAGSLVKIEVLPGDMARPDVAPPTTLKEVVAALRKTYPSNTIVATILSPDEGVTIDGKILPDLPDSAIDTVRPATNTRRADAYRSITRAVVPSKRIVQGKQEIVVKIQDLK